MISKYQAGLFDAEAILLQLREKGIKVALGSASKNAPLILKKLEIEHLFDAVIDGNKVSKDIVFSGLNTVNLADLFQF